MYACRLSPGSAPRRSRRQIEIIRGTLLGAAKSATPMTSAGTFRIAKKYVGVSTEKSNDAPAALLRRRPINQDAATAAKGPRIDAAPARRTAPSFVVASAGRAIAAPTPAHMSEPVCRTTRRSIAVSFLAL